MRNTRALGVATMLLSSSAIALANAPTTTAVAANDDCVALGSQPDTQYDDFNERPPVLATTTANERVGALPPALTYSDDGQFALVTDHGRELSIGNVQNGTITTTVPFDDFEVDYRTGLEFSPDGQHLAFLARLDGSNGSAYFDMSLIVVDLDGNETFRTPTAIFDSNSFDFSPDGRDVVYAEDIGNFPGRSVFVAKLDGSGPPVKILDQTSPDYAIGPYDPPKSIVNLAYSPDGTQIAFDGRNGLTDATHYAASHETYAMNADGSNLRQVGLTPERVESNRIGPIWSPDGNRLAFFDKIDALDGARSMKIIDLATDKTTTIPGTSGMFIAGNQNYFAEWSVATDRIVVNASIDESGTFEHGIYAVDPAGGTPELLLETESQPTNDWAFIELIPCSIVPPSSFTGLTPARIMDTRSGLGGHSGPVLGNTAASLDVTGIGGIPDSGVAAVALNVTVTGTSNPSFLTVFPSGSQRPTASNINWDQGGVTSANSVIVKVGTAGKIDIFNRFGTADVIVDVAGWFAEGPGFTGISPVRMLDTRSSIGASRQTSRLQPVELQIHGSTVPASATGIIMNLTAAQVTGPSFVSVAPSGGGTTGASNLNLSVGVTSSNLIISRIGDESGGLEIYDRFLVAELIGDVAGWLEPASGYRGLPPTRLVDTRQTEPLGPGAVLRIPIRNTENGAPLAADTVILNVTALEATTPSFLTIYPSGATRPGSSNVNFMPGQTVPNLVLATIGDDGAIEVFNRFGNTNVLVDVVGYFA